MEIKHLTKETTARTIKEVRACDAFIVTLRGMPWRFDYETKAETLGDFTALTYTNASGSIQIDIEAQETKPGEFSLGVEFQNRAGGWWYSWEEADKLGALNETIKAKTDKAAFKKWITRHFAELIRQVRTKKN